MALHRPERPPVALDTGRRSPGPGRGSRPPCPIARPAAARRRDAGRRRWRRPSRCRAGRRPARPARRSRQPGRVGVELHQQRVAGMAPGDVQGVDGDTVRREVLEDLPHPEGETDAGAPVEPAERVEGGVEVQARDHPEGSGSAQRRAVAVEVGQDVEARREVGRRPRGARRRGR